MLFIIIARVDEILAKSQVEFPGTRFSKNNISVIQYFNEK